MSSSLHANTMQPEYLGRSKQAEAEELAAAVAAFQKAGGKIQKLSTDRAATATVIDRSYKTRALRALEFSKKAAEVAELEDEIEVEEA